MSKRDLSNLGHLIFILVFVSILFYPITQTKAFVIVGFLFAAWIMRPSQWSSDDDNH